MNGENLSDGTLEGLDIEEDSLPKASFLEGATSGVYDGFFHNTSESVLSAASIVDLYYTPLLCFLGILGNSLSLLVFCKNGSQRRYSSSFYLSALAISDSGFLLTLFVVWLDRMLNGIILSTTLGCPLIMYAAQVFCFLSVWLTVGFTVERYFAVCSPLKKHQMYGLSKARRFVAALVPTAFILFTYVLIIARALPQNEIMPTDDTTSDSNPTSHDNIIYGSQLKEEESSSSGDKLILSERKSNELARRVKNQVDFHLQDLYGNEIQTSDSTPHHQIDPDSHWHMGGNTSFSFRTETYNRHTSRRRIRKFKRKLIESRTRLEIDKKNETLSSLHNEIGTLEDLQETTHSNDSMPFSYTESKLQKKVTSGTQRESTETSITQDLLVCTVPPQFLTISIIANYIDSVITLIIPFCLIAYLNIRINQSVMKVKEERKQILAVFKTRHANQMQTCRSDDSSSSGSTSSSNGESKQEISIPVDSIQRANKSNRGKNLSNGTTRPKSNKRIKWIDSGEKTGVKVQTSSLLSDQCNSKIQRNCKACCKEGRNQTNISPFAQRKLPQGKHGKDKQNCTQNGERCSVELKSKSASTVSAESRVTRNLLLVSTVFLLLNLPSHFIRAAAFIQNIIWTNDLPIQKMLHAAQLISNILLFNTNFAVNFLLYCLSGKNFRSSLKEILLGKRKKRNLVHNPSSLYLVGKRSSGGNNLLQQQQQQSGRSRIESTTNILVLENGKTQDQGGAIDCN